MKLKYLSPILLTAIASNVNAEELSYTFIEAYYINAEADDIDSTGRGLTYSVAVHNNVFLLASLSRLTSDDEYAYNIAGDSDEATLDTRSLGIGFNASIYGIADIVGTIQKNDADLELGPNKLDVNSEQFTLGLRSMLGQKIEVNGGLIHARGKDDDSTGYGLGGRLHISSSFSLGASYSEIEDTDTLSVSIRFSM